MKRLLCILLVSVVLVACQKDEEQEPLWISLSQQTALLRGNAGSTATVTVKAHGTWTLTIDGRGFDATPAQGGKGVTQVVITAHEENTDRDRRQLGSVILRYTANSEEYTFDVAQSPATVPQTMLLYMPGQSLLGYYRQNIEGIKTAINSRIPGDGRILVCYQPKGNGTAELSEIYYDTHAQQCAVKTLKTYSAFAPENTQSVQQMFADVIEAAPAREYGFIIGSHGKAWLPIGTSLTDAWLTPIHPGMKFGPFGPLAPGALQTRSFGDSGHELDISDLSAAIRAEGLRLSYLIFDACFMANIETLYDLRTAADRIIASPCEIMGAGFPYNRALPYLFTENGTSHNLQAVCEEFWRFYMYDWDSIPRNAQSGCISLTVSEGLGPLADVMHRIEAAISANPDLSSVQTYEPFSSHLFYDLGDYVRTACRNTALVDEFTTLFDIAFPKACRLHTPSFYSDYNAAQNPISYYSGISISGPAQQLNAENQQTAWYRDTH